MQHNITRPIKRPDTDNIAKIVLDSLNGLAYKDDSAVVDLVVKSFGVKNLEWRLYWRKLR